MYKPLLLWGMTYRNIAGFSSLSSLPLHTPPMFSSSQPDFFSNHLNHIRLTVHLDCFVVCYDCRLVGRERLYPSCRWTSNRAALSAIDKKFCLWLRCRVFISALGTWLFWSTVCELCPTDISSEQQAGREGEGGRRWHSRLHSTLGISALRKDWEDQTSSSAQKWGAKCPCAT